jgi:aspartate carbamoyltransferase catalytic subunit
VHSLCKLLALFERLQVQLISPPELKMPGDIVEDMCRAGHQVIETEELEEHISHVDIAYSTRIQEERFTTREEADLYRGRFRLNQNIYTQHCEPNTVIMHPLPRDSRSDANELDNDLNDNPNLAIFRQTDNGVLVRMALFAMVLDVVDQVDREARDVNWYTGSRFQ